MIIRFHIYARKSTEDKARQVMSIPSQIDELKEFAEAEKLFLDIIYQEERSAKTPGRPEFNRMLHRIETSKEPRGVLAWHPDRLARNSLDGGRITYLVGRGKMHLKFKQVRFENDPQGIFMLNMAFAQSQHFSDHLSETMKRGYRARAKKGLWLGKIPYGYTKDPETNQLVIDETQKNIVLGIFKDFTEGKPIWLILKRAKEIGFNRSGHSTIQHILANRFYAGMVCIGEETFRGNHAPIISGDVFYSAAYHLKQATRPTVKVIDEALPLRGVILCQQCGGALTGCKSTGHGGSYYYYKCNRCPENHSARKAHDQLMRILKEMSLSDDLVDRWIEGATHRAKELIGAKAQDSDKLKKEIATRDAELESVEQKFISGQLSFEVYNKWQERLKGQLAIMRERLDIINIDKDEFLEMARVALPQMRDLGLFYTRCNVPDKQEFIRLLFPKGLLKVPGAYRTNFVNNIFNVEAATRAGLQIVEDLENSNVLPIFQSAAPIGIQSNLSDLIRFIAKRAA